MLEAERNKDFQIQIIEQDKIAFLIFVVDFLS